ncbi:MAG: AAA family ATPase [Gammaproteobacteria bacterium]|nr:AAA family ATPase [Gammaproteobacteria bacterium]
MYLEHFGLHELPFRLSPDPAFLYLSKHHARAKAYMESTVWFTDGFVVITGEIGSGKTTLIESFIHELEKDVVVAQVNQTQVSAIEFLQSVLVQFGFSPFKMKKAELLATLNQFLVEQYAASRKVLLIVDEAQNLANKVLEELRMLSGVETTKDKVLRIILAGQPELSDKLDSPELIQLSQRVRLRFHLTALSPEDMRAYVLHRLDVAGSQGRTIFHDDTFPLLYRYTGGVPRLVNTLCDTAMMSAFALEQTEVSRETLRAAIDELQWVEFAARTSRMLSPQMRLLRPADPSQVLARLILTHDGTTVGQFELHSGRVIIGRTSDNDIPVDSKFVSRHHCQITTTPEGSVLEDLNSTNGVFIKKKRVRRHHLNDGDVIVLGRHELMYLDERAALAREREEEAAAEPPAAD